MIPMGQTITVKEEIPKCSNALNVIPGSVSNSEGSSKVQATIPGFVNN